MSIFAELDSGIVAPAAADTRRIAARVAAALPPDRVLALSGDLGAGKTTFVQGLAAAWGVPGAVTSPSFTICNFHDGERLLVHVDAYRLERADDWDGLMLEEFLRSPWCVAVEWPERVGDRLPANAIWLRFEAAPSGARVIRRIEPNA